jgi:hypothetical protein
MGGGGQDDRSWAQTRVSGSGGRWRSVHSPVKRAVLPPLRPHARGNHPRRGHGGAADRSAISRFGAREGAKGPASPPGLRRARAEVHACARASLLARTRARTRTRRRRATAAAKTGWLTTARRAKLGKRRARVGEGGDTYKKAHPSLARWPASPAAAARWRGAGDTFLPRLEGRGVHKREAVFILTSVAPGRSVVRRCSVAVRLAARRKKKQAAARRRGRRGSRGSR